MIKKGGEYKYRFVFQYILAYCCLSHNIYSPLLLNLFSFLFVVNNVRGASFSMVKDFSSSDIATLTGFLGHYNQLNYHQLYKELKKQLPPNPQLSLSQQQQHLPLQEQLLQEQQTMCKKRKKKITRRNHETNVHLTWWRNSSSTWNLVQYRNIYVYS